VIPFNYFSYPDHRKVRAGVPFCLRVRGCPAAGRSRCSFRVNGAAHAPHKAGAASRSSRGNACRGNRTPAATRSSHVARLPRPHVAASSLHKEAPGNIEFDGRPGPAIWTPWSLIATTRMATSMSSMASNLFSTVEVNGHTARFTTRRTDLYALEGLVRDNRVEVRVLFGACFESPAPAGLSSFLGPSAPGGENIPWQRLTETQTLRRASRPAGGDHLLGPRRRLAH
jgi:hypothetical protein